MSWMRSGWLGRSRGAKPQQTQWTSANDLIASLYLDICHLCFPSKMYDDDDDVYISILF